MADQHYIYRASASKRLCLTALILGLFLWNIQFRLLLFDMKMCLCGSVKKRMRTTINARVGQFPTLIKSLISPDIRVAQKTPCLDVSKERIFFNTQDTSSSQRNKHESKVLSYHLSVIIYWSYQVIIVCEISRPVLWLEINYFFSFRKPGLKKNRTVYYWKRCHPCLSVSLISNFKRYNM